MKLVFGSDHAGFKLRKELAHWAENKGFEITHVGAENEMSYDYPDAANYLVEKILSKQCEKGILVCGSGVGICIRANRFPGIRAAHCQTAQVAELARQHNHINVLCLGQRLTETHLAINILQAFLNVAEDLNIRHVRRVQKLDQDIPDQFNY